MPHSCSLKVACCLQGGPRHEALLLEGETGVFLPKAALRGTDLTFPRSVSAGNLA